MGGDLDLVDWNGGSFWNGSCWPVTLVLLGWWTLIFHLRNFL